MSGQAKIPPFLQPHDTFARRHIGPDEEDVREMLSTLGLDSLEALVEETLPAGIRMQGEIEVGPPRGERELLAELHQSARRNRVMRSYIGMGYSGTIVPPVIARNVLENPGWYTQYTPYQAEISQGRLEALLVFQTAIAELTGLPIANASLLDEATAAAEAMTMCLRLDKGGREAFFVSERCHPQTIAGVEARARALGIELLVGSHEEHDFAAQPVAGALVQYPATDGEILDYAPLTERAHAAGALVVVAADLLSLALLRSPGELGADVAVGSTQRFGVPMGYGGPHAAFLATRDDKRFARQIPGRIIGVSRDRLGNPALRMALQTREQHIRREKATSNICTAQVLLAIMAGLYAAWHGPEGLAEIAGRVHGSAALLAEGLSRLGLRASHPLFFDSLRVEVEDAEAVLERARQSGINLRPLDAGAVGVALDETVSAEDLRDLLEVFGGAAGRELDLAELAESARLEIPAPHARAGACLEHEVFRRYHGEHEMVRWLHRLESRDLSLTTSMIPLGSCTMKLTGTSEMLPVSWPEYAELHPFAPLEQAQGYRELFDRLEGALAEATGLQAVSLQPNAGSQGELTGLLVIRARHESRGEGHRRVCLIPTSAHGTNPASAIMAGMRVVTVACDRDGNIDVADLRERADEHRGELAALMVTYPSTHGVFEEAIREICEVVHEAGGLVYLDGANLNAQLGLTRPGDYGADVCHLNLHKTFAIPHGGGGPGMGPIAVTSELAPFLPGHPVIETGGEQSLGCVAAAPWGSAGVLPISWVYMALMGSEGLRRATQVAILNANYMAARLAEHYPVLYRGARGRVAHEFILDLRPFEKSAHIKGEDVAKRLMDYGFHAPTMSFPVAGTLMVEPTESEPRAELDRLCDALIAIRGEIRSLEEGRWPAEDNPLVNAPHTAAEVSASEWSHPYTREEAAFPAPWVRGHKFWPAVARVDNGWGDRNLVTSCPPVSAEAPEGAKRGRPAATVSS